MGFVEAYSVFCCYSGIDAFDDGIGTRIWPRGYRRFWSYLVAVEAQMIVGTGYTVLGEWSAGINDLHSL